MRFLTLLSTLIFNFALVAGAVLQPRASAVACTNLYTICPVVNGGMVAVTGDIIDGAATLRCH